MRKLAMIFTLALALIALIISAPAQAATLEVRPPGGGGVGALDVWTSIQAAVNAASDDDVIFVHNGDGGDPYTETITITDKSLTITGESEAGVIVQADTSQTGAANVFTINAAGKTVTISNMTIRYGDYGIRSSAGNVNVLNCTMYHNGWDGTGLPDPETDPLGDFVTFWATYATDGGAIRIQTSAASEIAHCTIYENDRGIRFQDGDNGNIHNNVSHDNLESGIYLAASSYSGANGCTNTDVNDNECYGNMNNGILSIGGWGNTIRDNDVYDNWTSGIAADYPSEITIQGNTINNNNVYGFTAEGTQGENHGGIFLSGDTAVPSRTFTAKILGNTISNNNSGTGADAEGMRITSSVFSDGIEVRGNTFTGHDIDMLVHSQAATMTVKENCFDGPPVAIGIQNDDAGVIDATLNAWGHVSGPYHLIKNAAGTGHSVSDNVDIYPWYLDCTMTTVADLPVYNVTKDLYYNEIQPAIDAADADNEITVAAGTFVEQLEITIPLTITGAGQGSTIVQSPNDLLLYYTTSADNYPIVYLHDVVDVNISELTIDGAGKGNANPRFNGIAFRQAGGIIQNVTIINVMDTPFSGAQHGVAIYAFNDDSTDRDINILNCTITDFQKTAIALNGANANCRVEGCIVTGEGDTTVTAQNGIQFGWGAGGTIKGNTVSDIRYTGPSWSATGILGYGDGGSAELTVEDNTVTNTQGALQIYFFDGDVNVADNNLGDNDFSFLYAFDGASVTGNTFDNCTEGLYLADVTNITGSDNTFNDCNAGLVVDGAADGVAFSDCQFNNNTEIGIAVVPYDTDNPDNVSITCSQIAGNADYGVENTSSNVVDANNNWWGDSTGPSGAGGGSGDAVSANVDFFPWLLSTDCGDVTPAPTADFVVDDDWELLPNWATVDVGGTDYYIGLNAFDTIQEAIDAAGDDDIITVADGNYPENVVINKSVKITGAGGETSTIESATGTVLVSINTAATNVEFAAFTLKHTGTDNWSSSYALLVNNGAYANIHDNVVADFKKRGIYVEGTDSSVDITDNTVIGEGDNGLQNGIAVWNSGGGFASIVGNEVSGGTYTGEDWSGSGILILDTYDKAIVVAENYVYENQVGIGAGDYCEYNPGSYNDNVTIQGNTVADNDYGIEIFNDIRGAHVVGNVVTGSSEYGIGVYDYTSSGWSDCLPPTDTIIQYNNIADNNVGLWVEEHVAVVNAKYNFWGHITGPQDPNGTTETDGVICHDVSTMKNADGLGDDVSEENADYCPWLAVPIITSKGPCPVGDLDGDCDVDLIDFARMADNWLVGIDE